MPTMGAARSVSSLLLSHIEDGSSMEASPTGEVTAQAVSRRPGKRETLEPVMWSC